MKNGFQTHREQTEAQVLRLEQIFEQLGKTARGETYDAILGILAEGEDAMDTSKGAPAFDRLRRSPRRRRSSITRSPATAPWKSWADLTRA